MRDALLAYYERELTFLRKMSAEFAEKYPKIAQRLVLEPDRCEDPHVERLIEAFAFLAARVHLKIDDEFPEITESLLHVLYPHYLSPVPSMAIAEFVLDPEQGKLSSGYSVDRYTTLYSKSGQDTTCRFRTCYPVTLWPFRVSGVAMERPSPPDVSGGTTPAALRIGLRTHADASFAELDIPYLRFFLAGEGKMVHGLYESLFGFCRGLELRRPDKPASQPIRLPLGSIREVGFSYNEGMLPYSPRSFLGYRLLQEYFAFPHKFLFLDVGPLKALQHGGFGKEAELVFFFGEHPKLDRDPDPENFRLGCTPVINLFHRSAEPIRLDHAHTEYRVIPDIRRQLTTEIYSVDQVESISPHSSEVTEYQPFYSFKHGSSRKGTAFWHASRRQSQRKNDPGTEVYLSLVDLSFRPTLPPDEVLTVRLTCTNRDLPGMLDFGHPEGDLEFAEGGPIKIVRCLTKPSKTLRPPLRHGAQWRLVSHLSLNYLSLVDTGPDKSPEALREILSLYNFAETEADRRVLQQLIEGLTGVSSRQVIRRIRSKLGSGFARGVEALLEFDENKYVGTGVFLFSSVLEKFLGLYVSINSFSQTVVKTNQRGVLKQWPPRSGQQILL